MDHVSDLNFVQMRNFSRLNKIQLTSKMVSMNPKIQKISDYLTFLEPLLSAGVSSGGNRYVKMMDSDGDSLLFTGLLNTVLFPADKSWALKSVVECQGPDGQFYRSPRRMYSGEKGCSRDMSLGVLCAMIDSEFPAEAAQRWLHYIDHSRPCLVKKPKWAGGGCALRSPIYKFCSEEDDRANITPAMWAIMGRVWQFRGWKRHDEMKSWDKADGDVSIKEAEECDIGYQLHLKAVQAYIKYLIGQSREYSIKIGEICWKRQPDNLFYEFLARRYFTTEMIDRYLAMAEIVDGSHLSNEWMWEKSQINPQESSGWCMLFMGKLIMWHCLETASTSC